MGPAILHKGSCVLTQRGIKVRFAAAGLETDRRNSDDDVRFSVNVDRLADNVGSSSIILAPKAVPQDRYRRSAGTIFRGQKGSADRRTDAQHRKQINRHPPNIAVYRISRRTDRRSIKDPTRDRERMAFMTRIEGRPHTLPIATTLQIL